MRVTTGFKRYKSLFDDCLYKTLPPKNGNGNYQIQIRQCDSTTHFSVYYTDGYKMQNVKFAQGYNNLKNTIKEIIAKH